jgi:hypothetical protein
MAQSIRRVSVVLATVFAMAGSTHAFAGPCFMTFPEQRATGRLNAGASILLREWSSRCSGLFTASSGGGTPVLLQLAGGKWVPVGRGASIHVPQLAPGSYRLVVENTTTGVATYSVRYRTSGG